MRLDYFPETDSLYIELADRPGADVQEIRPGIVLDLDASGIPIGIDIERAARSSIFPGSTRPTFPSARPEPGRRRDRPDRDVARPSLAPPLPPGLAST